MVEYLREDSHFSQSRMNGENAAKKIETVKKAIGAKINAIEGVKRTPEKWWKVCEMSVSVLFLFCCCCDVSIAKILSSYTVLDKLKILRKELRHG